MKVNLEVYSQSGLQIFQNALKFAARMGHGYLGSEHLLWALAKEGGRSARLLKQYGLEINTFTVNTDCGNVSVLGTEFEILEQPNAMTVKCHDGRVKVTASGDDGSSVVLDKGECVEVTKTEVSEPEQIAASEQNLSEDETEEKSRIIEYNREPLMNVVSEIERCFEVTVKNKSLCSNLDYSGVFYTDDMDLTLEIVFSSCGFDYELIDENMIELKNIE